MEYMIKKVDTKEIEYNFVNCDTCKIFLNGFLIGRYNFVENKYTADIDDWCTIDYFQKLTKRQQKLILIGANKYFSHIYKKIYLNKIKNGDFFATTDENIQSQLYYAERIKKCKNNIEILNNKIIVEFCPYCETEQEISINGGHCNNCNKWLKPCSICYTDITNCKNCIKFEKEVLGNE